MALIDIGSPAIDRAVTGPSSTLVDKNNPANASGKITEIRVWAYTDLLNCEVATFYIVSGNNLSTRDHETIGTVTAGAERVFSVNIDVQAGDYIGLYYTAGAMELDTSGGVGIWRVVGDIDAIPCTNQEFGFMSNFIMSICGRGVTVGIKWNGVTISKWNGKVITKLN